ncbi:MAG: tetratricopeptide repeat protein [Gammaproteobacteria bacterium]|nr:tetratricopeptide repeat protein [Gammaproteobacteria bacterium]MDH5800636.1 tetratricopeptide repeat protein [Gammaproteobacteria bacterium]
MEKLDEEELLHLALGSTKNNNTEEAITFLKRALALNPNNANVMYLQGALHAEIGMFDRAISEIEQAVTINPELYPAHFQLGLLYLTRGDAAIAEAKWEALNPLGEETDLFLFKTGMLHLSRDEFEQCIQCLELGIARNTSNPALNSDMEKVLRRAKAALGLNDSETSGNENPSDGSQSKETKSIGSRLLRSAYKDQEEDDKNSH